VRSEIDFVLLPCKKMDLAWKSNAETALALQRLLLSLLLLRGLVTEVMGPLSDSG